MSESLPSTTTDAGGEAAARDRAPLVGLGMPVYNGERYLADALRSILGQTFRDFELVVCDNASTDRTEAICREFARQDVRVRYFRNDHNLGAHPNYNLTFHRSRGRYFKWVPHDDVMHPEYLAACVERLESDAGAVLCQSMLEYIDADGQPLATEDARVPGSGDRDPIARFAALTLQPHTCYDVMGVFRRDVLAWSMLLPSFHGADRALLAQLAILGRFTHVPRPLLRVRDHAERYTRAKTKPAERAHWHDTRHASRFNFPTWRLYATYWSTIGDTGSGLRERLRLSLVLVRWWFFNWNAARMAVDLVGGLLPDAVGAAQGLKQRLFSPAPGVDRVRAPRSR